MKKEKKKKRKKLKGRTSLLIAFKMEIKNNHTAALSKWLHLFGVGGRLG